MFTAASVHHSTRLNRSCPKQYCWQQQTLTAFAGLRGAASAVFAIIAVVSPAYSGYDVYNIIFCVAVISATF